MRMRWLSKSLERRKAGSSQDVTDVKVLLRDSVSAEVLQSLNGGSTLCLNNGNASTLPDDNISDCSQHVNESNLEG